MRRSSLLTLAAAIILSGIPAASQTDSPNQGQTQSATNSETKKKKKKPARSSIRNRRAAEPEVRPGSAVTPPDPTRPGTPPSFPRQEPDKDAPINPPDPTAPTATKPPAE